MGMLKEFREFAMKGNVVDMAIGVVIGAAFGSIVSSLIGDMIMPVVGSFGSVDFSNMFFGLSNNVRQAVTAAGDKPLTLEQARAIGPVLAYGKFITVAINFMILAAVIFMLVKMMNSAKKRFEKEQAAAAAAPPEDVVLLREIRDALRRS